MMVKQSPGQLAAMIVGVTAVVVLSTSRLALHGEKPEPPAPTHDQEPELATFMGTLQRHSMKLGYSIDGRNQPLAAFYLHETREVLAELRELHQRVPEGDGLPIGKTSHIIMTPSLEMLADNLKKPDWPTAELAYHALIKGCNDCHTATQHQFIVVLPAQGPPPFNQKFNGP